MDSLFRMPDIRIPTTGENFTEVMQEQIKMLQANLKQDEDLAVYCDAAAGETIRVLQFGFPGGNVALIIGVDPNRNLAQIITHTDRLQLTCKICKLEPNTKRTPIGFSFAVDPK